MAGENSGEIIGFTILYGILLGLVIVPFFVFAGCLDLVVSSMDRDSWVIAGMIIGGAAGVFLSFFLGHKIAKATNKPKNK